MEFHSLYRSANLVRVIESIRLRWAGNLARIEEGKSAFKILTVKSRGKRPLGRCRHKWEENVRMDLKEVGITTRNSLIRLRILIVVETL